MPLCVHSLLPGWQVTVIDYLREYSGECWVGMAHAKGMWEGAQLSFKSVSQWVCFKDNRVPGYEGTCIPAEWPLQERMIQRT